ncbi:hypothetical protein BRD56_10520 [Thermoplasmatales archaeon SW_10_69_26]|nr:MAG: hypothetical protein BRD56_10520 [Thermoplasmatales archaeon SW_10_69_26]
MLVSRRRMRRLRWWVEEADPDRLVLERRLFRLGRPRVFSLDRPIVVWTVNGQRQLARATSHPSLMDLITDRPTLAHRTGPLRLLRADLPWLAEEPKTRRTVRGKQDRA